jgi:hypothetical protein
MTVAFAVLLAALVLAGLNVPGAAWIGVAALLILLGLLYIGPWLGPRGRD